MPKLTDQQRLKEIKWRGEHGDYQGEDYDWLLALASAYLELKEGLKNGELLKRFIAEVKGSWDDEETIKHFIGWLLSKLEKK